MAQEAIVLGPNLAREVLANTRARRAEVAKPQYSTRRFPRSRGGGLAGTNVIVVRVQSISGHRLWVTRQTPTYGTGGASWADDGDAFLAYPDPAAQLCNADADGSYADLYLINNLYFAAQIGDAYTVVSGASVAGLTANERYVQKVYYRDLGGGVWCFEGVQCVAAQYRGGLRIGTDDIMTGCLEEYGS